MHNVFYGLTNTLLVLVKLMIIMFASADVDNS